MKFKWIYVLIAVLIIAIIVLTIFLIYYIKKRNKVIKVQQPIEENIDAQNFLKSSLLLKELINNDLHIYCSKPDKLRDLDTLLDNIGASLQQLRQQDHKALCATDIQNVFMGPNGIYDKFRLRDDVAEFGTIIETDQFNTIKTTAEENAEFNKKLTILTNSLMNISKILQKNGCQTDKVSSQKIFTMVRAFKNQLCTDIDIDGKFSMQAELDRDNEDITDPTMRARLYSAYLLDENKLEDEFNDKSRTMVAREYAAIQKMDNITALASKSSWSADPADYSMTAGFI